MAIFRNRFRSKQDIFYAFAACVFPIHFWLILNVLREVPAWILRLTTWDLIGVIAYSLVYALMESLLLFSVLLLLGVILPARFLANKFLALSSTWLFLTAVWFVILHYNSRWLDHRQLLPLLVWVITYFVSLFASYVLVMRSQKVEASIEMFVRRVAVLSVLYLFVDAVALVAIIIRNV